MAAGAVVVAAGLLWRSGALPLAPWLKKYGGDALWALLVLLAWSALVPRWKVSGRVVAALATAFAVEFGQLWRPAWLEQVRHTRLGALALGSTFNPPDLLAYAAGIGLGGVLLWQIERRFLQSPVQAGTLDTTL